MSSINKLSLVAIIATLHIISSSGANAMKEEEEFPLRLASRELAPEAFDDDDRPEIPEGGYKISSNRRTEEPPKIYSLRKDKHEDKHKDFEREYFKDQEQEPVITKNTPYQAGRGRGRGNSNY